MSTLTTFAVDGMTCDHCVRAVTQEVERLPGVQAVEVGLVAGGTSSVTITSDQPVDVAAVAEAVDEAGYTLV